MIADRLNAYFQRKELSNKAKEEIRGIIVQAEIDTQEEAVELAQSIINLNIEIAYRLIGDCFGKMSDETRNGYLQALIENVEINKTTYLFATAAALYINGYDELAKTFYKSAIFKFISEKKINKTVFINFEKILPYAGTDCFIEVIANWSDEERQTYLKFLQEFSRYTKKETIKKRVAQWLEKNGVTSEVSNQNDDLQNSSSTERSAKTDAELVADLQLQIKILQELNEQEKQKNKQLQGQVDTLSEDLKISGMRNIDLQKLISNCKYDLEKCLLEVQTLRKAAQELMEKNQAEERERAILQQRLGNVESAYSQAGTQELDEIKHKIQTRLANTYSKYLDLKDKEPDLDYYDILIFLLNDVFKTLKKVGIEF